MLFDNAEADCAPAHSPFKTNLILPVPELLELWLLIAVMPS